MAARGHDLAFGIGIAQGFATLGRIGFEGRFDYAAIGSVTNLAARLCCRGRPWQVLVTDAGLRRPRTSSSAERSASWSLGFSRPVRVLRRQRHRHRSGDAHDADQLSQTTGDRRALSDLDEAQRYARFDDLQQRMPSVWDRMGAATWRTSRSSSSRRSAWTTRGAASGSLTQAKEERFLFLLLLLRQPRLRMIYVTSMPIAEAIVEYYLALLPGVIPSHARARLTLVSVGDSSPRVAQREAAGAAPRCCAGSGSSSRIRSRCHLIPYNTTELERDIALTLGIPMYGADPRLADLGTKTGCRRLFAEVAGALPARRGGPAQPRRDRRRDLQMREAIRSIWPR